VLVAFRARHLLANVSLVDVQSRARPIRLHIRSDDRPTHGHEQVVDLVSEPGSVVRRAWAVDPRPAAERCPWPYVTPRRERLASVGLWIQSLHHVTGGGLARKSTDGAARAVASVARSRGRYAMRMSRTLVGGSVRSR
jgi:hypothetical protein